MTPDLKPTEDTVHECLDLLEDLDRRSIDATSKSSYRASQADLSRDLLRLSDKLAAAASQAREEYWRIKSVPYPEEPSG